MKILINFLFILILIDCVYLRRLNKLMQRKKNFSDDLFQKTTESSIYLEEQNQDLVKQLIDELTNNLHNETLINKIRFNLDDNNDQQLISNLTGNLANKDPLMNEYLDEILKTYLNKIQQQSSGIDLMDILKQFQDIVSISNLTSEFELINKTSLTNELINRQSQDDFELIYSKNSTTTKLSRMEFLTDTLISLLIGKLIGLKIGFFAGKLISSVPFSLKKQCCNTNTWPSDMPGMAPTEPTSIIRNQFISMKTDKKPVDLSDKTNKTSNKSVDKSLSKPNKNKTKSKPIKNEDEWAQNEDDEWSRLDEEYEEEYEERSTTKRPSKMKQFNRNRFSSDAFNNFNKQIEESIDDLDEMPNFNFKQYTNYHPIYSTLFTTLSSDDKNSPTTTTLNSLITNYPTTIADIPLYQQPTTQRNRKHYMLLTGK